MKAIKGGTVNERPLIHAQADGAEWRSWTRCGKPDFKVKRGLAFDSEADDVCLSCARIVRRRARADRGSTWLNDEGWLERTRSAVGP